MSERNGGALGGSSIAPIYQRLPRGPHGLGAREVARNQRLRIHGAMVEAVAERGGLAGTTVKQIVGLAGVSRRAFYEQFANREECFMATFDLIAARCVTRVNEAYRATAGGLEERIGAAVEEFADEIESNAKGASLAIVEAQMVGAAGQARLRRATLTFEQMLSSSFARSPEAGPLPVPIVRGIAGGLQEAASARLRAGCPEGITELSEEMVGWTLLFHASATGHLSERLAARANAVAGGLRRPLCDVSGYLPGASSGLQAWMPPGLRAISPSPARANGHTNGHVNGFTDRTPGTVRELGAAPGTLATRYPDLSRSPAVAHRLGPARMDHRVTRLPGVALMSEDELRERLRASVLNLVVIEDYHGLAAPQIAEEAGIPMEAFFQLYPSKEECFLAAFDDLGEELLQLAADPELVSCDWARAVRRVVGELLSRLAERPLYAQIIACVAPAAGREALERDCALAYDIATLLTEGAPEPARNELAVEGVAGAIWHTIRCQVANGQIHLLPALADYLTYIVLTPFIGADAAAEVVLEDEAALAA